MSRDDDIRALVQVLEERRPAIQRADDYYAGTQRLGFLSPEVAQATQGRLRPLSINWARMSLDSIEERLTVAGFKLASDQEPDAEAWRIWQANDLDEWSQQAHVEALLHGASYVIVWAGADERTPRITVESPRQLIVQTAPGSREVVRALKAWTEDGYGRVVLFERDAITKWRSVAKVPDVGTASYIPATGWTHVETIDNPLGVVPVVPLRNRPRLLAPAGSSELADVFGLVDAIAKLGSDLMTSAEFSAMPRRFATGVEIAEEPVLDDAGEPVLTADGEPVMRPSTQFSPVAGRVWLAEAPESKFGQFPEAQLSGFLDAIRMFTHAVAALTGLPAHYISLSSDTNPASADAIRSAEASLVAKCRRKQTSFGGSWEQVMRLAFLVRDGRLPDGASSMETVWADAESRTEAQTADAVVKLHAAGILPVEAALERLGYSPQERDGIRAMRRRDALDRVVLDLEVPKP